MARLFSDLLSSGSARYYFNLESAPGGVNPGVGGLTVVGLTPTIFQQGEVFRTPATAVLTLTGQQPVTIPRLSPGVGTISLGALVPGLEKHAVITNALPPDYTDLPDNPPTVLTQMALTPTTGSLVLQVLAFNLTQGGNIGFVSPTTATLSLLTYSVALPQIVGDPGSLTVVGLTPTLATTLLVEPETAALVLAGNDVTLTLPFRWIDDEPATTPLWIDD